MPKNKGTQPIGKWRLTLSQLSIFFENRFQRVLKLPKDTG